MKRVIALVLLLSGVLTLFTFNIFASTPAVSSYKTTTRTVSPITFKVSALQMDAQDGLDNGSAYDYEIYIGASVTNSISTACYVDDLSFTLNFGDSSSTTLFTLVDMETYSTDLELSCVNHTFGLVPSNEFSWSNGIVVPAHSSLYLVAKVRVRWTGPSSSINNLNSITAYNFTTTTSDVYVPGTPVDFSPIINYLEAMPTQTNVNNVLTVLSQFYLRNHDDIEDVKDQLQDIIDLVTYSGTIPSYTFSNGTHSNINLQNVGGLNLRVDIDRYVGKPVNIYSDNEIIESTDTALSYATTRYPFIISMIYRNSETQPISVYFQSYSHDWFPNITQCSLYIESFSSNIFSNFFINTSNKINLVYKINTSSNRAVVPVGATFMTIIGYIDVPYGTSITFPALTLTDTIVSPGNVFQLHPGYYPKDEYSILRDIYISIQSTNQSSVSSDSGTLKTESDTAHQQEQSYFAQNSQAIQATGLSNYRFDTVQQNGINAVSIDFTSLWNAIGSWNSVYIFSLTLGLALTILRHAPNAISSARRKREWHNSSNL